MNNTFIKANVLINNYTAGEEPYIVASLVSNELWYYGRYDSMERAEMIAAEFENAVVIEEV